MAYIPTMARDLRRACGQELAKYEINAMMDGSQPTKQVDKPEVMPKVDPSKIPGNIPVGMDVGALDGISVQTVNALRQAGLTKVGDIMDVPDEHLCKMQGLGEKSVAHIRAAIAKASETKP
jgi:DNA-directed RNA polymerase alpha subunit